MRVPDSPIHMDALLAWAAVDEATEAGSDDPIASQHDLPLQRVGDPWCFAASMLMWSASDPAYPLHMTRPTRVSDYAQGRAYFEPGADKLTLGSGRHKAYLYSHRMAMVREVRAYGIGDIERVGELLRRVKSIGKLRRHCAGDVTSLEVHPDATAADRWKVRVLPFEAEGYARVHATVRPPYWDRSAMVAAYMPLECAS